MRLKIICNGHSRTTKITNAETGEELKNVRTLSFELTAGDRAKAVLEFEDVEIDAVAAIADGCPECGTIESRNIARERRANGYTNCLACGYREVHNEWSMAWRERCERPAH